MCEHEKLFAMEKFVNTILLPILGDFISRVSVVSLKAEQLETIRTSLLSSRPVKRLAKNVYTPHALLMRDQCFLTNYDAKYPIIAVEIKPKNGFFNQHFNSQLCNFCVKQNYLSKTGKDGGLKSIYCPLDLFSGNLTRMESALESLMDIPKNNLRLFMNGALLHDENSTKTADCDNMLKEIFKGKSSFCRALVKMLTTASSSGELKLNGLNQEETESKRKADIISKRSKLSCQEVSEPLPRNCVLDRILRLQTCPTSDVEAEKLLKSLIFLGIDQEDIQKIICGDDQNLDNFSEDVFNKILKLQQYCMSVTAKDLSIIVTISQKDVKDETGDCNQILVKEKLFRYNLSIIDLDPKSLNKIPKYIENKRLWSST